MTAVVLMLVGASCAVVLGGAWVVHELVRQQGRLVLRLDTLERDLATAAAGRAGCGCAGGAAPEPTGLAVGAEVPAFTLPDLDGRPVRLQDFRGRRVLLVNWNPGCGFCARIAPELARRSADLRARGVELVLVARGGAGPNRALAEAHGLAAQVLVADDGSSAPADVFGGRGTPVAYLIDAAAKVAEPLAVGAVEVPALVRRLLEGGAGGGPRVGTRSLEHSRIARDGLKAGTPAPAFALPDLLGGPEVTLEAYRGRKVLLVFSDPDCGPCRSLAPRLAELHRAHPVNGPSVIMVGRGDPEANRREAAEHGFDFPVVLQQAWELSRAYGIFATPVGFLIDERGAVARPVARGADAILALARPAAAPASAPGGGA